MSIGNEKKHHVRVRTEKGLGVEAWDANWRDIGGHGRVYTSIDKKIEVVFDKLLASAPEEGGLPLVDREVRVAELFGGHGELAEGLLKRSPDVRYYHSDFSPKSVKDASERLSKYSTAKSVQANAVTADYLGLTEEKQVSAVLISGGLTTQVLNDKEEAIDVLVKASEILAPDGTIIITGLASPLLTPDDLTQMGFTCSNISRDSMKGVEGKWFYIARKTGSPAQEIEQMVRDDGKLLSAWLAYQAPEMKGQPLQELVNKLDEGQRSNIEQVDLCQAKIQEDDLLHLASFPNLTHLSLRGAELGDQQIKDLKNLAEQGMLKKLTYLDLSNTKITKEELEALIENCPNLETLRIGDCPNIDLKDQVKIRVLFCLPFSEVVDLSFLEENRYNRPDLLKIALDVIVNSEVSLKDRYLRIPGKFITKDFISYYQEKLEKLGWTKKPDDPAFRPSFEILYSRYNAGFPKEELASIKDLADEAKERASWRRPNVQHFDVTGMTLTKDDLEGLKTLSTLDRGLGGLIYELILSNCKIEDMEDNLSILQGVRAQTLNLTGTIFSEEPELLKKLLKEGSPLRRNLKTLIIDCEIDPLDGVEVRVVESAE